MRYSDAVFAFLVATAVALLLTPLAARLAWKIGATAKPNERGLAVTETPLLGGLAILAGVRRGRRDLAAGPDHPASMSRTGNRARAARSTRGACSPARA